MAINNEFLTLGRGKVHFAKLDINGNVVGGNRPIGNAPEFTLTIETENLEHFDSQSGVNVKDADIPLTVTYSGTIVTDNLNQENLALFFFSENQVITEASDSVTGESIEAVVPGNINFLGASPTNPTGVRNLTAASVAVTDDPMTTTYTEGDDYTVDYVRGTITVLEGGAISEGDDLLVDYDTDGHTRNSISSGRDPVSVAIYFRADNASGVNTDYFLPNVTVTPNGDLNLISGDDWASLPLTIEALADANGVSVYMEGQPLA